MQKVEFLEVAPSELRKNPWNSNRVSPDNEEKIRNSLQRNGMFKPIIVRQVQDTTGYEILGGEHRWEQGIELGYEKVPVANLGYISDVQAKEIGVIDNARYGIDDAISLADILKEIGDFDQIQSFLPYGVADLDALFSSSDIALDELELDDFSEPEKDAPVEEREPRPTKTHAIARFKLALRDAERLTGLIAMTQKQQGFTAEDDLTNAGDALVYLLSAQLSKPAISEEETNASLDAVLSTVGD